jgi:transketolase N-terminal domain/subunit
MNSLERRIIDLSYEHKLTHIGSCLNAVNFIDHTYEVMRPEDKFVLSQGHAFLALAVVLEKHKGLDAAQLVKEHGTHPIRNTKEGIFVSTGSLGQGLTVAVGMALADRSRDIYVVSSDGEMAEGACWEALRIASEQKLENIKLAVIANGYAGYSKVDVDWLDTRLNSFYPTLVIRANLYSYPEFLQGLKGHYTVLNKEMYEEVINAGKN